MQWHFGTFYNFHFRVNCHKFLPFKREVNYSIDFNFRFRCDPLFLEIKRKHCKFFTNVPTFRVYVNEIEYPFKGTNLLTSHNCSRQEILRLHEINSPLSSMNWSYWIWHSFEDEESVYQTFLNGKPVLGDDTS